jgi:flavin reductase (DIM6/NTAB) family NADH-FMN oxidoreductase RutF
MLSEDFKDAMRRLATTVSIIAVGEARADWRGMAATAVTSVSVVPPTILVAVNRDASIRPSLEGFGHFAVNLLAMRHHFLVPVFGGEVAGGSRFDHGAWDASRGAPMLVDAAASLLCRTTEIVAASTHDLFLAEVVTVANHPDIDPLLWVDGKLAFATAVDRPSA